MADVAMPRLSDSMEEGTILKWLKSDGDEVSEGEELVEIETDKANMTYEADEAGTLSIVAQEGDTLSVGETIARIGEGGESEAKGEEEEPEEDEVAAEDESEDEGEEDDEAAAESGDDAAEDEDEDEDEEAAAKAQDGGEESAGENGRVKASPIARRMAREMGLELAGLKGTGPGGRIVKADVEAAAKGGGGEEAAEQPPPAKEDKKDGRGEVSHEELTRLQRTVARRMAESKATAPDFVMTLEVEMDEAVALRQQLKAAAGDDPAPSFNDFVVRAAALALRDFPRANGAYRDGAFELYSRVNVGVAVAGQDALVVPTVFDADTKSLGAIAADARRLAERVREGKITPPELSGGTFTVSNLGMYGIRRFVAVINPPQAAILAVGEMTPRPVVRDGDVVIRTIMELTLSCDHRILYGADAARFLGRIREYLETPLRLAL